jgi:putative transposase
MMKFRSTKSLQKFAAVHASINNHSSLERHFIRRQTFKKDDYIASTEWRQLAARKL